MKKLFVISSLFLFSGNLLADDISAVIVHADFGENNGSVALEISAGIEPFIFSWTGPDGFTSNEQDITGLLPGEYCVIVNDFFCGVAELCVTVEEMPFVEINDPVIGSISVYPNPFNSELDVSISTLHAGLFLITLEDQTGRIVWEEKKTMAAGETIFHISTLQLLSAGIYHLIMKDEKNQILIARVVNKN